MLYLKKHLICNCFYLLVDLESYDDLDVEAQLEMYMPRLERATARVIGSDWFILGEAINVPTKDLIQIREKYGTAYIMAKRKMLETWVRMKTASWIKLLRGAQHMLRTDVMIDIQKEIGLGKIFI